MRSPRSWSRLRKNASLIGFGAIDSADLVLSTVMSLTKSSFREVMPCSTRRVTLLFAAKYGTVAYIVNSMYAKLTLREKVTSDNYNQIGLWRQRNGQHICTTERKRSSNHATSQPGVSPELSASSVLLTINNHGVLARKGYPQDTTNMARICMKLANLIKSRDRLIRSTRMP